MDYIFIETGEIIENIPSLEAALARFRDIYAWDTFLPLISEETVMTWDSYVAGLPR